MLAHADFKTIGLPGQPQPNVLDTPGGSVGPPPPPAPCVQSPPTIYWRLNQASGNEPDTADAATLTAVNGPGSNTGIQGNARTFNGTNQYFTTPGQGSPPPPVPTDPSTNVTISGWLYLTNKLGAGTIQTVMSKANAAFPSVPTAGLDFAYDIIYNHDADAIQCRVYEPGGTTAVISILTGLTLNTWYNFTFMWDMVNLYGASNGGAFSSVPFGFVPNESHGLDAAINVGAALVSGSPTNFWNGRLDAIGIWRGYNFTTADQTGYYNGGVGREWTGTDWSPVCPAAFTTSPYGVAGAVQWVKSDIGTFQDTALTIPAVAGSAPVGGWQDQTGLGNHMLQATAGARPTLQLAQKNALASVRCDGVAQFLKAVYALPGPYHLFLVINEIAWASNREVLAGAVGDNFGITQRLSGASPQLNIWNGTGTASPTNGPPIGTWSLWQVLMAGSNAHFKVNAGANFVLGGVAAAGGLCIGSHPNPSNYCNVEFGEIIVYNVALSDADETTVRNALNARWAIF